MTLKINECYGIWQLFGEKEAMLGRKKFVVALALRFVVFGATKSIVSLPFAAI